MRALLAWYLLGAVVGYLFDRAVIDDLWHVNQSRLRSALIGLAWLPALGVIVIACGCLVGRHVLKYGFTRGPR